jgi:alpha-ketoglutarate-dependent taurine dioxygenase
MTDRPVTFHPVTSCIGAEVSGVDLGRPLSAGAVATLRQGLLDHLVLFFRDQPIGPEQLLAFAGCFGAVMQSSASRPGDRPGVNTIDLVAPRNQGADVWHTDHLFMPEPALATILHGVQIPDVGGDTCFANMYLAYETLSPPLRQLVDGLSAVHTVAARVQIVKDLGLYREDIEQTMPPPVTHPLVRVHPETGRRALYFSEDHTTGIVGLNRMESRAILGLLFEHVKDPYLQCRFHWRPHSVAMWDNRAVQHYGVPDYVEHRVMHRTMIAGDAPVGPGATVDVAAPA